MSTTTDSVDQIFKVTVDGVAYVLKLVTIGAPALVRGGAALTGYIHGKFTGDSKLKGEVSVNSMLRRGQGLAYYMVADRDLEKFQSSVKKSTLLYGITDPFKTDNGKAVHQIIVPRDQVPLLNEIIRFNRLNVVKHAEMEQVSAQPIQTKETQEHEMSGVSVPEKTNSEKNKEFISHIRAQIKEREWSGTPEEPTVNPPTAARTEAAEHLSAVESRKTDSRQDPSRLIQETGELPGIKGRDELMKQVAMRPVEDFLSPAYCKGLEKARWADTGKHADILVDLNGNRQLEIRATIIGPIYEGFNTATNFYGFDDAGEKYPLFTTDSRTVAPYQNEKVFQGSMEEVKQYLSEWGVSQLISESDYIKQTEATEHSIAAEPQKTNSRQDPSRLIQETGELPGIKGRDELMKQVAMRPVEDFLSPAYCKGLEKARWADTGKHADILVDLNGNRRLEIRATIIEPIYEGFDTATNFYGFDDAGEKYPLFTTDSRTVAPYQNEKVFQGSMEEVKQYLSEWGVSQLISESDYIKQTEATEHSIAAEPQKTNSRQDHVNAARVTGERPSIRGKVEMLKKDVAKQPDLEISHGEPKIDLPEVEK